MRGRGGRRGREYKEEDLLGAIDRAIREVFSSLRRSVQKNLSVLTLAFIRVLSSVRSGHGKVSLRALARALPTEGTAHSKEKRLHRFLNNPRLDGYGVTGGLVRLIIGVKGKGFWPVIFDQSKIGSVQVLYAGIPYEGRILPISVYTFEYPWIEERINSQNQLEHIFLLDIEDSMPEGVIPVFIGDRGYARSSLLRHSLLERRLYIIRGRAGTVVEIEGNRMKLGRIPYKSGEPTRVRGVLYHAKNKIPVDVITYWEKGFKEPWWLLVPCGSEFILPTDEVIRLYRQRMQIEQSFRDFKTHLGLRGLKLKVRIAERMGRLLLSFTIAYTLAVILGASHEAERARSYFEIPRRTPRHGTTRTLSVLTLAMHMLSHPYWKKVAYLVLISLAEKVAKNRPLLNKAPPIILSKIA